MNIRWYIPSKDVEGFVRSCEATMRNVHRGTKGATEQACREVLEASLAQVPRDTNTLASTAFYDVQRRGDVKGYLYEGTVGYAGMGRGDAINPKNGRAASVYALKVHEDLTAYHPVGKAKFLEDPLRAYAEENFTRVAESHWYYAINGGAVQY